MSKWENNQMFDEVKRKSNVFLKDKSADEL